jgi:hypothetical protein
MNRTALKNSLCAASACAVLGLMLTACGGGGSSATPQSGGASTVTVPSIPATTVNNFSGPTSKLTVSITIPSRTPASAAVHAKMKKLYGHKNVRSMANTSPSASIRALGVQQNRSAQAYEKSTGRRPDFISSSTQAIEFVLSDQFNSTIVDQEQTCNEGNGQTTCTMTIDAPLGNNFTASLFLYDNFCGFLLSAGSTSGINVVAGTNPTVNITLNGVVSFVDVEQTGATLPLQEDSTLAQTMNVTVTPMDADMNVITATPANTVLVNNNFVQITQYQLSTAATDASPAQNPNTPSDLCVNACPGSSNTTVNVAANLTVPATTFAFSGTGFEQDETIIASAIAPGNALTPSLFDLGTFTGSVNGQLDLPTTAAQLQWVPQTASAGVFALSGASQGVTDFNLEFPSPNNNSSPEFSLNETIPGLASNVTIGDNGACGSTVGSYMPTLGFYPLTTINTSPYFQINMNSVGPTATCVITASDDASTLHQAVLFVYTDSSSVTVQSKIRSNSQSLVRKLK